MSVEVLIVDEVLFFLVFAALRYESREQVIQKLLHRFFGGDYGPIVLPII
jgi:hypothetical protein